MKTSSEANQCARAIVALVEQNTGKELSFEACMKITACVQMAINESTKENKK